MLTFGTILLETFAQYKPGEIYIATLTLDLVLLAIFATWLLS